MATALPHPLPTLRRLPAWHLALSVAAAARVELALRRRSLPGTARALGLVVAAPTGSPGSPGSPDGPLARLPRWTMDPLRATAAVMRWWPLGQDGPRGAAMCLRRSLVTAWRLRSLDPTVRIGVAVGAPGSRDEGVRAHAWVEVGGLALDARAPQYTVMTSLAPRTRVVP